MPEAHQDQGQVLKLSKRGFALACAVLIALHLVLTVVACPPRVVFGARPYGVSDYHTHFQQAHTVGRAIARFGKTWAYDPDMLAGVPAGLFFDVDNKAHALCTYALTRLGLDQPVAFNLFTLLSCLLAPLSLLAAARLFRLGRGAQLIALGLGVALWHFDSGLRYFWSSGMVSFCTAAHGSTVALALLFRVVEERRWRHALSLALLLPLLLLVHVWAFVICVVPMSGLYLARARRLPAVAHIQVWLVVAAALLVNGFWLWPALAHLDLLAPAAVLGQANPVYLLADYLGVARLPYRTDFIFLHTFYRVVAMLGAATTLWAWRRGRDGRFGYTALALAWLWGLAYVGGLIPGLRATEPYRFIAPAMLLSATLAGAEISRQLGRRPWSTLSRPALAGLALLVLLVLPRPLREMLYFLPELSPPAYLGAGDPEQAGDRHFKPAPPAHRPFRLQPLREAVYQVARKLDGLCGESMQGRVLVREWPLAESLRWATRCPIMGGFGERRTIHESANLFRWKRDPRLKGRRLAEYLRQYAIRYIVVSGAPSPELELRPDLVRLKGMVAGHRIHEVLHPSALLARGRGRVEASLNRIEIRDAIPDRRTGDLVLRFHHMRTLRCSPACRLAREAAPGDPAGFIRVVPDGQTSTHIVIQHGY